VELKKLILLRVSNSKLKIKKFGRLEKDALFLWKYKIPFVTSTYAGWEKGNGGNGENGEGLGNGKAHIFIYKHIL
jgi:hypothetical protein